MRNTLLVFALLAVVSPLYALETADTFVVVPFVTNSPGAFAVESRTELFVANRNSRPTDVRLTLYPFFGGAPVSATIALNSNTSVHFNDVVGEVFGLKLTTGQLIARSLSKLPLEVQGRYHRKNTLTGDDRHEPVRGIGWKQLGKDAFLFALSGNGGNSVTLGAANPSSGPVDVTTVVYSAAGALLYSRTDTVPANQNLTLGSIFSAYGIPPQDVQVEMRATGRIYGYGMEIDAVTNDWEFETGVSSVRGRP